MQTILLSLIAGLLAIDILFKHLKDETEVSIFITSTIILLVFILIASAIFFGIAFGLNLGLGAFNLTF